MLSFFSLSFSLFLYTYSPTAQNAAAKAGITPASTQPETMEWSARRLNATAYEQMMRD